MIRFGIPNLDYLLGYRMNAADNPGLHNHQSLCIVGAPGTSKSILSLHMAATFMWSVENAVVFYISTDWSHALAEGALKSFCLDHYPERYADAFRKWQPSLYPYLTLASGLSEQEPLEIIQLDPERESYNEDLLNTLQGRKKTIGFVDLKRSTAGDDWGHILNMASVGREYHKRGRKVFFIVDAIEGLEMLTGDSDQFGQPRSRRQRIAQLARVMGDMYWALVIEDRGPGGASPTALNHHYDEEFITDVVIRLGLREVVKYSERYVEVTKCRGNIHQLGKHPLLLRDGSGSSSNRVDSENSQPVEKENADDPRLPHPRGGEIASQSYVHVIPSIHSRAAALLANRSGTL